MVLVLSAAPARGQTTEAPGSAPSPDRSLRLQFLLGTEAALHSVDMISTAYNLRRSDSAREGNPVLASLSGRPAALVALSSAVNALQIYTISKVNRRHPKLAAAWALILIGTETYAVTNNLMVARQLGRTTTTR